MRVKFLKQWAGPYGIFTEGRVCELSGPMLAACPRDVYEEAKEEPKPAGKQAEPTADKQQKTPANKEVVTSKNKQAGKQKKDESKKQKTEQKAEGA